MQRVVLKIDKPVDIDSIIDVDTITDFGKYKKIIPAKWGVITILMFEEFYFRIRSDLSVTIISEKREDKTTVEIISAGGKGSIGGNSFGAEKKAVHNVIEFLTEQGFEVVEG